MEAKHTPTPWLVGEYDAALGYDCMTGGIRVGPVVLDGSDYGQERCGDSNSVPPEQMIADASLIGRAVNSHAALVEALKWYVRNDDTNDGPENAFWLAGKAAAIEALALAGETP